MEQSMTARRRMLRRIVSYVTVGAGLNTRSVSIAQDASALRPLRLLIGYGPGGGVDNLARAIAPALGKQLGKAVVIENRAGASGTVAAGELSRAAGDGYTLMLVETGTLVAPLINAQISLDPANAFTPIAGIGSVGMALVCSPQQPFKTIDELIAKLKARPAQYSYGSPGIGTIQHLTMELFKQRAGVFITHIPYRGATAILPDVIGNQIELGVVSTGPAIAQVNAGRIRVLAVTGRERLRAAPELPLLSERFAGLEGEARFWLIAPRGLPASTSQQLHIALRKAMDDPKIAETYATQGGSVKLTDAAEATREIAAETMKWSAVVKSAQIKE